MNEKKLSPIEVRRVARSSRYVSLYETLDERAVSRRTTSWDDKGIVFFAFLNIDMLSL
jgi:hypothetical protein